MQPSSAIPCSFLDSETNTSHVQYSVQVLAADGHASAFWARVWLHPPWPPQANSLAGLPHGSNHFLTPPGPVPLFPSSFTSLFALLPGWWEPSKGTMEGPVSVCSGCQKNIPQTGYLSNTFFFSQFRRLVLWIQGAGPSGSWWELPSWITDSQLLAALTWPFPLRVCRERETNLFLSLKGHQSWACT